MKEKLRPIDTLRMAVVALHLVVTFVVLCCKKRSIWQAITLISSTGIMATALLTPEETLEKPIRKIRQKKAEKAAAEAEEIAEEELCENEEDAELIIDVDNEETELHNAFCGNETEESTPAPAREIPRDEEASEADFQ